jgi:hypothetical protein
MQTDLSQTQLEALIDLMVLATMSDKAFSSLETESLEQFLEGTVWNSGIGISSYKNASFARARAASSPSSKANYLQQLCRNFLNAQERQFVLGAVSKLLASDSIVPAEHDFLEQLKHEFGIA